MSYKERLDSLEAQIRAIDKKVWLLIIIFIVFALKSGNEAIMSILTGAAIAPEVREMEPWVFLGLAAAAGSAFRAYLGFIGKRSKNPTLTWDWGMFWISVLPAAATAFVATSTIDLEINVGNTIMVFLGAAGLNSLQDKFGLQKKKK